MSLQCDNKILRLPTDAPPTWPSADRLENVGASDRGPTVAVARGQTKIDVVSAYSVTVPLVINCP